MDIKKIGNIIRDRRIKMGMTQQELADKLYLSRKSISLYESGNICPNLENLKLLADILNLDIDSLLSDKPTARKKKISIPFLININIKEFNIFSWK